MSAVCEVPYESSEMWTGVIRVDKFGGITSQLLAVLCTC
jgi:hypothetical protein